MAVWEIKDRKHSNILDQLLENRGFKTAEEKYKFLNPEFADLFDPFLMGGVFEAVERIKEAYENNEVVGIFSDYDADGIPGAALFYRTLKKIGVRSEVYIPNRESGYGLSKSGIDYLVSKKCSLIITIDLGIRNFEEALYCKEKKVDLIITDHHLPDHKLPEPLILINPKVPGDKYPFKELCGCGVAYKLIQALAKYFPEIDESFLKWNLDLVAISTISDVVPLISENRILAKYGLVVLQKTKNIGLQAMYKVGSIDSSKINSYITGFQISPRINAPGRMDHATKSFELLASEDPVEAEELANWLEEKNLSRQRAMDTVEKEALAQVEKENLTKNNIIIVYGDWNKGVIGPTASRLVEKTSRPVIIFSEDKDAFVGSARSIEGINIVDLIAENKNLVKKYGGHKGAAGLTVLNEKFKKFLAAIIQYANEKIDPKILVKKIKAESQINPTEIATHTVKILEKLEPYGMGNPRPVFYLPETQISNIKTIGKEKNHLSFEIKKDKMAARCVYFFYPQEEKIVEGNYDLVFNLENNFWNGKYYVNVNISGMRKYEESK